MSDRRATVAVASVALLAASAAATFVACGSTGGDAPTSGDGAAPSTGDAGIALDAAAPAENDASAPSDGSIVEAPARCNTSAPFQAPVALDSLNTAGDNASPSLSPDELTIYFDRTMDLLSDIYVATRATTGDPFGTPVPLTVVNSPNEDSEPAISADGSTLFLISDRVTEGDFMMYMSVRAVGGAFATPTLVPNVNGTGPHDGPQYPFPLADGTALWFTGTSASGSSQISHSSWSGASFGTPVAETELAGSYASVLTADALTLFVSSGVSPYGVLTATRADASVPFSAPTQVSGLDRGAVPRWVSPDGCNLYFTNPEPGTADHDLYVASRGQ